MRNIGDTSWAGPEVSLASAATVNIGGAKTNRVTVTGTTTITSFGTVANRQVLITFSGALTLTHNSTSLILPGGANIMTTAGDSCLATSDASGNWTVEFYTAASANLPQGLGASVPFTPPVTSTSGTLTTASATGRYIRIGKRVDYTITATITTNGTGAGAIRLGLPFNAAAAGTWMAAGRDDGVTSKMLQGRIYPGTAILEVLWYDGGYPGSNGVVILISGTYEAA